MVLRSNHFHYQVTDEQRYSKEKKNKDLLDLLPDNLRNGLTYVSAYDLPIPLALENCVFSRSDSSFAINVRQVCVVYELINSSFLTIKDL